MPRPGGEAVVTEEFRDDDAGFLTWIGTHPEGYVLNMQRGLNPADARIHHATCATLTAAANREGRALTGGYLKVCGLSLEVLDAWTHDRTGTTVRRCGMCLRTSRDSAGTRPTDGTPPGADAHRSAGTSREYRLDTSRLDVGEVTLRGPGHIPFDHLTEAQKHARAQLRAELATLHAGPGQVLEARYAGPKPANADVENLLLYNIEAGGAAFAHACRHGVRFEFDPHRPAHDDAPGTDGGCVYRYRLVDATRPSSLWVRRQRLVAFADARLGRFPARHRLAQTWAAIHASLSTVSAGPIGTGERFGVFLTVHAPRTASTPLRPELVKSLVDGTVAAFQAHGDRDTAGVVAPRIAGQLGRDPRHVEETLLDTTTAVLGVVSHLVRPRHPDTVHWYPGDHLCVAGEVTLGPSGADGWALAGEVWSLSARRAADREREPAG